MTEFTPHTLKSATGEAQDLLQNVNAAYGFVPNLFSYMAEAPTVLQAYLQLNELLEKSSIPAAQLQVALLAVSKENDCGFCTVAHRAIGKQSGANPESLNALNEGREISDPQDRAIADFTKSVVRNRGWVPEADTEAFLAAGFTRQQILEVILVVTIKTLSNYCNHFTRPEANPELLAML